MNNPSLDVVICTYKRENFLLKNIAILKKDCSSFINHVYVIDNAKTLPLSKNSNFITIIQNNNIGGTGGYARGFYEISKSSTSTHFMLMDDDIEFDPTIFKLAISKLKKISKNDWLGFGMSAFNRPKRLYEMGAKWNGVKVKRNNANIKINSDKKIDLKKYNYSGWWSLIMPKTVINDYGYPFPFFIKFDDVEYALRRNGEKIVFDKQLYVRHESFKNKKSNLTRYYNIRNGLITNALHFKRNGFLSMNQYMFKVIKFYLTFQYQDIKATNIGVIDYLKGPDFIKSNTLDKLHKEIVKKCTFKINNLIWFMISPFLMFHYMMKILISAKRLKNSYKKELEYFTSEKYWGKQFIN